MTARESLPWCLSTSDAARAGLRRGNLRGDAFVRLRRGVWGVAGVEPLDADVRIASVVADLPEHACLGGWSAARVHEGARAGDELTVFDGGPWWEDRRGVGPIPDGPARVVVCAARDSRLVLRPDVRVFRSGVPVAQREVVAGMVVTSGDRTAFDVARLLPRDQAVVALDRLLRVGAATSQGIQDVMDAARRWRGTPAARRALALADGRAESPQETRLRLLWLAAGFPRPLCNAVVRDRSGRFTARVDLLDPDSGVVGEYDGAFHADAARRSDDARREELLEGLGLVMVRATSVDVGPAGASAWQSRLEAGYRRAARRPSEARRWVVTDA